MANCSHKSLEINKDTALKQHVFIVCYTRYARYTGDFKIDVYGTPLTASAKRQSLNLVLK